MKIKTYPLQFTEQQLNEIKDEATNNKMSAKEFMLTAIDKAVKESKIKRG